MPIQSSPCYSGLGIRQARGSGLLPVQTRRSEVRQPWPELPQSTLSHLQGRRGFQQYRNTRMIYSKGGSRNYPHVTHKVQRHVSTRGSTTWIVVLCLETLGPLFGDSWKLIRRSLPACNSESICRSTVRTVEHLSVQTLTVCVLWVRVLRTLDLWV